MYNTMQHNEEVVSGSRMVRINGYRHDDGATWFSATLWVNGGETITRQAWKGKTLVGARKWAARMLAR